MTEQFTIESPCKIEETRMEKKPIQFGNEASAEEKKAYRDKIGRALAPPVKGQTPVGFEPRPQAPLLGKQTSSGPLSAATQSQLEELARETKEPAPPSPEVKEEDKDVFNLFDFDRKSEAELVLNNKKRRAAVEARCPVMRLEDLIIKDEVKQRVPLVEGEFEVTFRSISEEEYLFIQRFIAREQPVSDRHLAEQFGLCQLACGTVEINGRPLPDHRDSKGDPKEDLFREKLRVLAKKSAYVIADLSLNYSWFDVRVRRLLNPDDVKNG